MQIDGSEESHFAGGVLLHASDDSPRFFHDLATEVVRASERDVASLRATGFDVDTISRAGEWQRETTFRRAVVRGAAGAIVEIGWAADSAFRFSPIERDALLGWRLRGRRGAASRGCSTTPPRAHHDHHSTAPAQVTP